MRSIALLVDDSDVKRHLKGLLGSSYQLMRGRSSAHIPKRPFDLAIVDLPALERMRGQLEICKESLTPVALPILLVLSPTDLESQPFQSANDLMDEIILTPIHDRELELRLETLFQVKDRTIQIERSYHALSKTSLAGVIIIQDRQIVFVNEALAQMCGLSIEEFIRLSPQDVRRLVHPDDRRDTFRRMLEVFRGNHPPFHTEFRYRRKDGVVCWVEMLVSRIQYHGQPALQGTAIDISERKAALQAVRQREKALQKAQAVSHVGSWVWDIQSNHLEWSDEMYRIFGIHKDQFSGDLSDIIQSGIHPDDREAVSRSNRSVIEDKKPTPLEYRVVRPYGSIRNVWAEAGELILDDEGQPAKLTGIVQDITDRKQF
jgi:PAS domain S-box-containing protein